MKEATNNPSTQSQSGWDPRLYDAKHAFVWKYGEDLVALLAPQSGECILDIGCGTGHLTAKIAGSGARVLGIDRSPEMVMAARDTYPGLQFEVADARDLRFHDEFSAVFSNAALHWILEPDRVVQNVYRALRPGGRFVAEFGGKGNIRNVLKGFNQAFEELHDAGPGKINSWYYPSVSEYASLLEKNGLEVRFITLFDRETPLADGESGIRNWITMFGSEFLQKLPPEKREHFFRRVEELLRPELFRDGQWRADYRRLRLCAWK